MLERLDYWVSSNLWLHLEGFFNAGLNADQCRAVIEAMPDPYSESCNLSCRPMGVNGNWIVETRATSRQELADVVERIAAALRVALASERTRQHSEEAPCCSK